MRWRGKAVTVQSFKKSNNKQNSFSLIIFFFPWAKCNKCEIELIVLSWCEFTKVSNEHKKKKKHLKLMVWAECKFLGFKCIGWSKVSTLMNYLYLLCVFTSCILSHSLQKAKDTKKKMSRVFADEQYELVWHSCE